MKTNGVKVLGSTVTMATYEIYPYTNVTFGTILGDPLLVGPGYDYTDEDCKRLCTDTSDCQGFSLSKDTNKCTMYKDFDKFGVSQFSETYVKSGVPSYWILWALIIGMLLILFVNKCQK